MSDLPPVPMVDLSDPELAFFPYRFVLDLRGKDREVREQIHLWVMENYGNDGLIVTGNQFWFIDRNVATAFKLRWFGGIPA